jgi:hypothetical protein
MTNEQIERIAKTYADSVQMLLTRAEFKTVRKRNASPEYETCDAVADFMDNEQLLLDVAKQVLGRDVELGNDADLGGLCDAHNKSIETYLTEGA